MYYAECELKCVWDVRRVSAATCSELLDIVHYDNSRECHWHVERREGAVAASVARPNPKLRVKLRKSNVPSSAGVPNSTTFPGISNFSITCFVARAADIETMAMRL